MNRADLSHIAGIRGERGTYEFSKLEYVLSMFVTALQGAICLGLRGVEKSVIDFRKKRVDCADI